MDQQTADQNAQDARQARIESLAKSLLTKRDEAISARAASGIERQWREDQRAFEGLDGASSKTGMTDYATGDAYGTKNTSTQRRSRVIVNIIRGKCETAEGRFTEIQFPTDDKNFGIDSTPVGESAVPAPQGIVQGEMQTGPMPEQAPQEPSDDAAKAKSDDLKKRASAMEKEIDDQLGSATTTLNAAR